MGLLDIGHKIDSNILKRKKFTKGPWGSPDGWTKPKSRYSRPRAKWNPEHMMWEKVTSKYQIFYFPNNFEGYVNINRKDIKNHAGWMLGSLHSMPATSGWFAYKVEDEEDFEVALSTIINQLKEEDYGVIR
jgi:hypothetical protein